MFEQERHICVLYITATCNLKCRYCYIDKSPALQKIDQMLEEYYQNNYFFNFMKEMFPNPNQLEKIEFWGGEPSYGLPRVADTIKNVIEYYPNLKEFMMSTNLTTSTWINDFFDFLELLSSYKNRDFFFDLQLSLDGPTYLNDINRGKNVTQKFTENFTKLVVKVDEFLETHPNITIRAHFKPTLDSYSIGLLQDKQSIINYYQFFELYKELSDKTITNYRWDLGLPNPNTATPSPHTVEDGKKFANMCRLITEIMEEDKEKHYFKYPRNIMPFSFNFGGCPNKSLDRGCGTCGTGRTILGLLPNKLISGCHNGFTELIEEYKQNCEKHTDEHSIDFNLFLDSGIDNKNVYTKEEYEVYEQQCDLYNVDSLFQVGELASLIQLYAHVGQVDKQYIDSEKAIEGAHFIMGRTASCLRDNLGVTGSRYLFQSGYIKLFLNGAKEYIERVSVDF